MSCGKCRAVLDMWVGRGGHGAADLDVEQLAVANLALLHDLGLSQALRINILRTTWVRMLVFVCVHAHKSVRVHEPSSERLMSSWPPVHLAMWRRSALEQRRTAMAPASTKYLSALSSMPLVVRMTLAPDLRIIWIRSLVMSFSLCEERSNEYMRAGPNRGMEAVDE